MKAAYTLYPNFDIHCPIIQIYLSVSSPNEKIFDNNLPLGPMQKKALKKSLLSKQSKNKQTKQKQNKQTKKKAGEVLFFNVIFKLDSLMWKLTKLNSHQ